MRFEVDDLPEIEDDEDLNNILRNIDTSIVTAKGDDKQVLPQASKAPTPSQTTMQSNINTNNVLNVTQRHPLSQLPMPTFNSCSNITINFNIHTCK